MGDPPSSSFGRLFQLYASLEETISRAARDGVEIGAAELVDRLLADNPEPPISASEIHAALVQAAARAGVKVRLN